MKKDNIDFIKLLIAIMLFTFLSAYSSKGQNTTINKPNTTISKSDLIGYGLPPYVE